MRLANLPAARMERARRRSASRALSFVLTLSVLSPLLMVSTAAETSERIICRTYYSHHGSRWRRVCWHPDRRSATTAPFRYWRDAPWRGYSADNNQDDDNYNMFDEFDDNTAKSSGSRPWREGDRNLFDEVDDEPARSSRPQVWKPRVLPGWDDDDAPSPKPPHIQPSAQIALLLLVVLCIALPVVLLVRFVSWLDAIVRQRRLDKLGQQVLSAQSLTDRLRYDAREADALIRALSRDAHRRGAGQ